MAISLILHDSFGGLQLEAGQGCGQKPSTRDGVLPIRFHLGAVGLSSPVVVTLARALTVVDRLRTLRSNMLKELNGQMLLIRRNGR